MTMDATSRHPWARDGRFYCGEPPARMTSALRGVEASGGQRNQAFVFSARRAEFDSEGDQLSAKLVLSGQVRFCVGRRGLVLHEGQVLLLNPGTRYAAYVTSDAPVRGATIWFEHGLADALAASLQAPLATDGDRTATPALHERLRPLAGPTRVPLGRVVAALDGHADAEEADEAMTLLLARWLAEDRQHDSAATRLDAVRASTRAELMKRIDRAADFIASSYTEPLTLDDIAGAAALSKFHLLRGFAQVHGVTPHRHLQAVRAEAARRLVERGDADLEQVALACGFGSRWSLQRALRQRFGRSGRGLREQRDGA
jgi:AraC family transcriptional regulator